MVENKYEGARYLTKLLLEEALKWKKNKMMHNFSYILQLMPIGNTSSLSGHFRGTTPFNIQVNFDIRIFEVKIDANSLEKWLNMIEGHLSIHNFLDRENITFALLKVAPMLSIGGKLTVRKRLQRNLHYF